MSAMVNLVQSGPSRSATAARVRPFVDEDIPQVAELHRRIMLTAGADSPALMREYREYFRAVFFDSPFSSMGIQPLVYSDESGRVAGFLGLVARPMVFAGKPLLAAISTQFVVDPQSRGRAGIELLRAAFQGPQDVLIADESNAGSRRLWEALGGTTALLYSSRWILPLRPCRFGLWAAGRRGGMTAACARLGAPAARMLDALAASSGLNPYRPSVPKLSGELLTASDFEACLSGLRSESSLCGAYSSDQVNWLVKRAERMTRHGRLHRVLVRDGGDAAGWYLYYLNRHGLSEILQVGAMRRRQVAGVFEHMMHHAWQNGGLALSGRYSPELIEPLSAKRCPFLYGPEWTLIHSRNPALIRAFERGDSWFSRLDGEWSLHFR